MYIYSGGFCPKCEERQKVQDMFGNKSSFELPGLMFERTYHKKFSAGKAAVGLVLTGGLIGAAAGALGKEVKYYECSKCGFTCDATGHPVDVD